MFFPQYFRKGRIQESETSDSDQSNTTCKSLPPEWCSAGVTLSDVLVISFSRRGFLPKALAAYSFPL